MTATDADGDGDEARLRADVSDVAPAVSAPGDATADEGQEKPFDLGSFDDPGRDDPWRVTIDWGDGTPTTTFESRTPGSLGQQPHVYAGSRVEPYTVTVTVNEAVDAEVMADAAEGAPPPARPPSESRSGTARPWPGTMGPT